MEWTMALLPTIVDYGVRPVKIEVGGSLDFWNDLREPQLRILIAALLREADLPGQVKVSGCEKLNEKLNEGPCKPKAGLHLGKPNQDGLWMVWRSPNEKKGPGLLFQVSVQKSTGLEPSVFQARLKSAFEKLAKAAVPPQNAGQQDAATPASPTEKAWRELKYVDSDMVGVTAKMLPLGQQLVELVGRRAQLVTQLQDLGVDNVEAKLAELNKPPS